MNNTPPVAVPRPTLASLIYFGCVAIALFMCTPAFVLLMSRDWHFSEASSGAVIAACVVGNTLGGLLSGVRVPRAGQRAMYLGASALMVAGYVMAAHGGGAIRVGMEICVAGIGGGVLSGVSARTLIYSSHPHRYLSLLALAQNLCAAVLMGLVIPDIGERWGAHGAFLLMALLGVPCILMTRAASTKAHVDEQTTGGPCDALGVSALLASTLTYYVLVGVVWTFVGNLGLENGLSAEDVDRAGGASSLLSLFVCLWAPRLEHSARMRAWSIGTVAMTMLGIVGMVLSHGLLAFGACMLVMNSGWTLNGIVVPCLFPGVDPSGRFVGLTAGLIGVGYSIGAFAGGHYLAAHSASSGFLVFLVFGMVSALVLLLVRGRKKAAVLHATMA